MRVGIDARLLPEQVTGIGRYTIEVARRLIETKSDTFYLYSPQKITQPTWQQENITLRALNLKSRATKMIWSQTYLPYWSYLDKIDVFWGPSHRLPSYLSNDVAKVVTIHDLVWKYAANTMRPLNRFIEKRLMPIAIRDADLIITDSKSTAAAISESYPEVIDKVRTIYLGASTLPINNLYHPSTIFNIPKPYFLIVGTLEPRKNLYRMLQAFALIDENLKKNIHLVVAGGDGWKIDLLAFIEKIGLTEHVSLVGYVNDQQLASLYAHSQFLAMPSFYEGFGLPILEAQSFGVPVLTSNTSSMSEIAGEGAILIDPYSVESIKNNLEALLINDNLIKSLSIKAKENANKYSWKNTASLTRSVLEEAIEVKKRSNP